MRSPCRVTKRSIVLLRQMRLVTKSCLNQAMERFCFWLRPWSRCVSASSAVKGFVGETMLILARVAGAGECFAFRTHGVDVHQALVARHVRRLGRQA